VVVVHEASGLNDNIKDVCRRLCDQGYVAMGGSIVLTWACTDERLGAIAPFYGAVPRPREAVRRLCPVVGSWPGKDFTTKAAGILETELTAARVPHDLKVYPGAKHSFFNDRWRNYHPEAAADSWERVLAFFDTHVRRGGR
jgi:carboxymethylenebutenolidase